MKRFNILVTLVMVCLGGFIGFDPNSPSQTANAEETRIRWVDVPKTPVDVLGLNENLSTLTCRKRLYYLMETLIILL